MTKTFSTKAKAVPMGVGLVLATSFLFGAPVYAQGGFPGGSKAIERMREADTNHDGQISRAELYTMRKTNWARMDRNKDGYFAKNDLPRFAQSRWNSPMLAEMRTEFDTNRDGRLSYAEFVNGPMVGFDMADTDKNGFVSKAELEAISAKVRAG